MSKIFSFCLFHTSFFPLWISILFIDIKSCIENTKNLWTEYISIGCIAISFAISLIVLSVNFCTKSKESTTQYKLIAVTEEKNMTTDYLMSYILPLFSFDFTKWSNVVLFSFFYLTLCFLCIRHNYFSINVVLELVNYRFYTCKIENGDKVQLEQRIISKRYMTGCIGNNLFLKSLNNEFKLDIK